MNQRRAIDHCKIGIIDANKSISFFQNLIDKWDDPQDLATRAAVLLKKTHKGYASVLYTVLKQLETNCKHPKKMQDTCGGVVYCMSCNIDIKEISKKNIKNS